MSQLKEQYEKECGVSSGSLMCHVYASTDEYVNEQVLQLVDSLFREFASSYLSEARQRAVEKLTAHNKPSAPCPNCNGRGVGSHNSDGLPNTCMVCRGTGTAHIGRDVVQNGKPTIL